MSERVSDTTLQMVRNVPHLALIPLVILWFGIEEEAKLFLVALGVFFPVYVNTLHGIRSVDPQLVEMGRIYGMSPWSLFWRVILPGALPVGLRRRALRARDHVADADRRRDDLGRRPGIGYMAMQAREFMLVDVVVLAILIYALLGKAADSATRLLERAFLPGTPPTATSKGSLAPCSPAIALSPDAFSFDPASGFPTTCCARDPLRPTARARHDRRARSGRVALRSRRSARASAHHRVLHGYRPAHPGRRVRGDRRPQRLRQEHAAAPPRRPRRAERRPVRLGDDPDAGRRGSRRIMFQEPRLLPWARVVDNVAVGLARRGAAAERLDRARAALDAGRACGQGRELAGDALGRPDASAWRSPARWSAARSFLALDEPLGALDALTRIDMQALLEEVWRAQGFTAVLVTHDVAEAVALADRILVLEEGRIALDLAVDAPRPRRRGDPRARGA